MPVTVQGRTGVRNSGRGNHLGQRSCASATKGRTYERKRSDHRTAKKTLRGEGRPHMHRGVHRDPRQVTGPQCTARMCHPQALGQKQFQLVAEALPPVAQVRALVREAVLEKLFPAEVLEIRIIDPALAHAFVGQPVNVLEQQKPDRKARLDPGSTVLAVERRDLAVDKVPVDLACELCQLVLQLDDLVETRPEQIARHRRRVLLRPHRSLRCAQRIMLRLSRESRKRNCKLPGPQTPKPCNLKPARSPKNDSQSMVYPLFTDDGLRLLLSGNR